MSGYLIVNLEANQQPLPPQAELGWWYQYYFATDRGVRGYRQYAHDFNKLIWHNASPTWKFDDATYDRTAAAFTNPDHVDIVIHNYRWRLKLAQGEPRYDDLDAKLAAKPVITVPTITIGSDFDGPAKDGASYRQCSPASTHTRCSTASGTTSHRKRPRTSPMPSSRSTAAESHGSRHRSLNAAALPLAEGHNATSARIARADRESSPPRADHDMPGCPRTYPMQRRRTRWTARRRLRHEPAARPTWILDENLASRHPHPAGVVVGQQKPDPSSSVNDGVAPRTGS